MEIKVKRVYEEDDKSDGIRVLVDRLWPGGIKKEALHYDIWVKNLTPSPDLPIQSVKDYPVITLLYASKDKVHNHAIIFPFIIFEVEKI